VTATTAHQVLSSTHQVLSSAHLLLATAHQLLASSPWLLAPVAVAAGALAAPVALVAGGSRRLTLSAWEELPALGRRAVPVLVAAVALAALATSGAGGTGGTDDRTLLTLAGLAGAALAGYLAGRLVVLAALRAARRRGRLARRALVIGGGTVSLKLVELLDARPQLGRLVLGYLDAAPAPLAGETTGWTYLGPIENLPEVADRLRIQTVLVGFGAGRDALTALALQRLAAARPGVQLLAVPRFFELGRLPAGHDHAGPIPLAPIPTAPQRGPRWALKRLADASVGAVGLLALAPVMVVAAVAVRLTCGPGPIVLDEVHVGYRGDAVRLWRFRTAGADGTSGPVGRWLARTGLDRLPRLGNLLAGDLSLVGPLPLTPAAARRLARMLPNDEHRLQVRGGLVGPASVSPALGEPPAEDALLYDTAYVDNWGLWTDATALLHALRRRLDRSAPAPGAGVRR
jgi:lipopolysaccharide/colanic/teichoic acid biosynthesis glycosyltransferase